MAELSKAIARLMEERAPAPPTAVPGQRGLVERLKQRVAPGERTLAEAFARLLLQRTAGEAIERLNEDALLGLCLSAYRFFAAPGPEPRVRVFNPEFNRDGWDATGTVVETVLSDRPFIVDTVRDAVLRTGSVIRLFLHPVVGCDRDQQRALLSVMPPEASAGHESFIHAEVERIADPEGLAALEADLRARLDDLVLATNDYQAMRQAAALLAQELRTQRLARPPEPPADEIAAFLDWLGQGNFVFLGYRHYEFGGAGTEPSVVVRPGSGLGLQRKERSGFAGRPRLQDLQGAMRRRLESGPPLIITKTNAESPIHRRARMDYIGVREYDAGGQSIGERRFIGLFTARAYGEESASVPLLQGKLERILVAAGAVDGSHDYRAMVGVFNSMPKEHLFAATAEELHDDIRMVLAAEGTGDVRTAIRPDQLERGLFVLVVLPRERYSADLRRRTEAAVARMCAGTVLDQHVAMDESDVVRLHFYVTAPPDAAQRLNPETLRFEVRELLRTWDDRLREILDRGMTPGEAKTLAQRYAAIFSPEYKAATEVQQAVRDIRRIEAVVATNQPQIDITNPPESPYTTIKLYLVNEDLVLSDALPVLENLGLRVFAEDPLDVVVPSVGIVHLHAFEVQDAAGHLLDVERSGPLVSSALLAQRSGRLVNDRLNALVVTAELSWREVQLLRAYANHVAQTGAATRRACYSALADHPECARLLWEYFDAKFNPGTDHVARDRRTIVLPPIAERFHASLDAVESGAEDRILRSLLASLVATTRTNYYAERDDGGLAVKLACGEIPHLPLPHPLYEIFVFAPHVEGVHLRAGRVARGGIRLTDRPDDYRSEVLGLMKTQMAKNAVIIPTGAKGAFFVRRAERGASGPTPVMGAYRTFISSLLDLTDNIEQGRVVAPPGVLYDEPDPYLVVAADKGTATFSDTANEVAVTHRFWLGDAFASGGSHGYDHKRIGITARGAWECVRRHFRELGIDADAAALAVVGIGDMSGDVFGNAMLLSRHLRLRAAFNHRHVFLDPEPDPGVSFAERERLFGLSRSGWDDYNPALLSHGGGVFLRSAKAISLTAEVRQMLGLEAEALSGEEVIRAILCMECDLLWNGGIGTYVKASGESHADAGDGANDGVRVDASDLRARVVGEGGNLGFTQRARVEYALAGGRINTDAIDNAGGVAMSDHEVNLKIALGPLAESSDLAPAARNRLLTELTEDVTHAVLQLNARQALALSLEQRRSQKQLYDFRALMRQLEDEGILDRALECLPDRESLRQRRPTLLGLTRPELAVLLAHTKLSLQRHLLQSLLPDDPHVERALRDYFPRPIVERYRHAVRTHRLRREIIAVQLANQVVDVGGVTFAVRVQRDTGCAPVDVVRAWAVVAAVSDLDALYGAILGLPVTAAPAAEVDALSLIEEAFERACKWLIETQSPAEGVADLVNRYLGPVFELFGSLLDLLPRDSLRRLEAASTDLTTRGFDVETARKVARLRHLAEVLEIAYLAGDLEAPLRLTAETYYRVGSVVDVDWVRDSLATCAGEDRWERRATEGLNEGLLYARRAITRNILACRQGGGEVEHCLAEYLQAHAAQIDTIRRLIDDVKSAPRPTLAAVVVVMREIGRLCGR